MSDTPMRDSIDGVQSALAERSYIADRGLATTVHLQLALGKPLLLEGEAGVGKTELAKVVADALGAGLRLLAHARCGAAVRDAGTARPVVEHRRGAADHRSRTCFATVA